ncbi:SDR family NAD(P)-dependent oxidoreductase [Fodinibius saliphilus]|uniref:SDR family NAD(P)-dependent oxidoreductase n=1 Tax=Fodinibius saliphilus TaxID=1920650 RepID=UPI001107AEEA|nr:SDR family oxidoreductase [Fodinibius saliphilus]
MKKTAIITGASRGIGMQTAKTLAEKEVQIIAIARSKKPLRNLEQINPDLITAVPTDLTDEESVNDLVLLLEQNYDGIDILINNAGALINKPFEDLTLDDWRSQIESNLITAVHITQRLLNSFNKNSHVVNISSMGGYQGSAKFPGLAAYSASKGALSILSECLATELSNHSISVNALCLGAVQTGMLEEAFPGFEAPVSASEMGTYISEFALTGHSFYNGKILPVSLTDPE